MPQLSRAEFGVLFCRANFLCAVFLFCRDNFLNVDVYFAQLKYQSVKQIKAYDLVQFMGTSSLAQLVTNIAALSNQ